MVEHVSSLRYFLYKVLYLLTLAVEKDMCFLFGDHDNNTRAPVTPLNSLIEEYLSKKHERYESVIYTSLSNPVRESLKIVTLSSPNRIPILSLTVAETVDISVALPVSTS